MNEKFIKCVSNYINDRNILIQKHPEYGICITSIYYNHAKIISREIFYIADNNISNICYNIRTSGQTVCLHYISGKNGIDLYGDFDKQKLIIKRIDEFRQFETLYYIGKSPSKDLVKKILKLFSVVPRPARPINRIAFSDIVIKTE
jgi:hypothetical protein